MNFVELFLASNKPLSRNSLPISRVAKYVRCKVFAI